LLLCRLVDILGLAAVLVPRDPGNLSAFGLLTVDVKNDYVQTMVARHDALDAAQVAVAYAELEKDAAAALDGEGFDRADHRYVRTADLRYYGQAFEVRVPVGEGLDEARAAFHAEHERTYGYSFADKPEQQVEWVNLRVTGIGPIRRPELRTEEPGTGTPRPSGSRQVSFDGYRETDVYWRPDLRPGDRIDGPAIVEEYGSTVPLHPGFTAEVDRYGNLVIRKDA
jgi:N-methylhydantoinase A